MQKCVVVTRKKSPPVYPTEGFTVVPSSLLLSYLQAPRDLRHTFQFSSQPKQPINRAQNPHGALTRHIVCRTTHYPRSEPDVQPSTYAPAYNPPPDRTVQPTPHAPQPRPRPPEPPAATSKPGHPAEPTGNQRLLLGAISRAPLTA